jgi:hypothetical protein
VEYKELLDVREKEDESAWLAEGDVSEKLDVNV